MSVFPPGSAHYLPDTWAKLMTDPASPMLGAYPTDFVTDLNGKKQAWQGTSAVAVPSHRSRASGVGPCPRKKKKQLFCFMLQA